jgi:hypothetical protein
MMEAVGGEGEAQDASGEEGDDWEGEEDDDDEEEGEGGWGGMGMGMDGGDDGPTLSDLMEAMDKELAGSKGMTGDFTRSEGEVVEERKGRGWGETGGGQEGGGQDDDDCDDDDDHDHDRSSQPVDVDLNLVRASPKATTKNPSLAQSTSETLQIPKAPDFRYQASHMESG